MAEVRDYIRDESDSDVEGIVVVDTREGDVRVAEKVSGEWCDPFWMPDAQFRANTHADSIQHVGKLSDEQFDNLTGMLRNV